MPITRIRTPRYVQPSKFGRRKRIQIPQPEERPIIFREKDVVQWGNINIEPWWFTLHRRGIKRPRLGQDQQEARAVSEDTVRGTLPERILYLYLVSRLKYVSGVDFDFQSSLQGGRMELGGIVADFLFPFLKIIIQVQGPTHDTFLRQRKDVEQIGELSVMGYHVMEITDEVIYSEYLFEEWMRRAFGLANGMGGSGGAYGAYESETGKEAEDLWAKILEGVEICIAKIQAIGGG